MGLWYSEEPPEDTEMGADSPGHLYLDKCGSICAIREFDAVEVRGMQLAGREAVHLIPEGLDEAGVVESDSPGILYELVYRA